MGGLSLVSRTLLTSANVMAWSVVAGDLSLSQSILLSSVPGLSKLTVVLQPLSCLGTNSKPEYLKLGNGKIQRP